MATSPRKSNMHEDANDLPMGADKIQWNLPLPYFRVAHNIASSAVGIDEAKRPHGFRHSDVYVVAVLTHAYSFFRD